MDIIVLSGIESSGKTATLNILYNSIINDGGQSTSKVEFPKNPLDFSDIVYYNNKKIAFYSLGDHATFLANAIIRYANDNCDLLICTFSVNMQMQRAQDVLKNFNATIRNKTFTADIKSEVQVNTVDAKTIMELI